MYQRPKAGESEEDLLKLQEEFFKNKSENKLKPAATVVRETEGPSSSTTNIENASNENVQERLNNTFEDIPKDISIGNIVEKHVSIRPQSKFTFSKTSGFPQAKRRDPNVAAGKGSLFSQQMKKLKKDDVKMEVDNQSSTSASYSNNNCNINLPKKSYIVLGNDREDIHKENLDFMSKMTEEEILEEREKLLSTMDPAIIAFLKSKRHHQKPVEETRQPSIAEQNKEVVDVVDIMAATEILEKPESEKWLNFDTVETSKLSWMKEVDFPKLKKDEKYEARFDFNGWLLPYVEKEITEKNRVLYHHGEEPGRPGYTLQELFQLCRSNIPQQKIIALNSIANILAVHSSGVYDNIIDVPLEQVFFVVRFCLDDNTPSVLNASIKALRNLFYYPIDEICLDNLLGFGLGFVQPVLAVDSAEIEDDKTVNDQQLAESNLVKCLIRTDILVRIRYIMNTVKPSLETIVYCLEILTRLVRDSRFVLMQVYKCDGLLDGIITNFVPKFFKSGSNDVYGVPVMHAVKFLRILSTRSRTIASELVTKYKVLDSIATYLSNDLVSINSNGLKLQIECFHLWSVLLHYGLGIDYFKILQPVLIQLLEYHIKNTNASFKTSYTLQAHTAAFLNLLSQVSRHDYSSVLIYIKMVTDLAVSKWLSQCSAMLQYSCGKLQIASSLLNFLANIVIHQPANVHLPVEKISEHVANLLKSNGFNLITKDIEKGSNVLQNYETHKCSANFKYTEAAVYDAADHIIPLLQINSCLPFITSLSNFVVVTNNLQLKHDFLNHPNIKNYTALLQKSKQYYLTGNWFTQVESILIINILKAAVNAQSKLIDTAEYYEVTVKCLSIFNAQQKSDIEYVLKNIVFSPEFYPSEALMQALNLNDENETLKTCLKNIEDIFKVYITVLGLRKELLLFKTDLCADVSTGNILPIDWIYSPIIALYSNQQQNKSSIEENEQIYIIVNCLRWVYVYETYFPDLAMSISPTDRFCRLACTFLGSDTLFLEPEIRNLLEKCLKLVLGNSESQINFNKTIHGLHNFQDFYTQLLEQYQGVSYGDKLFSNFILIPLAQRHDVKLRKTLWSEYAGIVQIFNLTKEEIFCPLNLFMEPAETDISLLKCYKRLSATGMIRKDSILNDIANYHVITFINRNKK